MNTLEPPPTGEKAQLGLGGRGHQDGGDVSKLYGVGCRLRLLGVTEGYLGGGTNLALAYQYLINLVGVTSGVLLLGESLTATKILGGAVILLGVYLARRR